MSINRITGVADSARASNLPLTVPIPVASITHPVISSQPAQIDGFTQSPSPARFPWMNRLSRQLEPAAPQRAAFPTAPALGDNLDQSA